MVKKLKGEAPTLPEEEDRDTNLVAMNENLNPNPDEEDQDLNSGEEQDGYAKSCMKEEEDVNSVEEEEKAANSENNTGEEDGEIGSEERSSDETPAVDDVQPNDDEEGNNEGSSSQTLRNCGDTRVDNPISLSCWTKTSLMYTLFPLDECCRISILRSIDTDVNKIEALALAIRVAALEEDADMNKIDALT
ncbi:hypothetical protein Bca52824_017924 [Brassica carinata]|uniref:Uncharacterized protein n=1 Tax=Brassica carinata TaxID=52824 RepID=A0A8X8AYV7_BRACI|nr:hypothetical protein Bca52824_017924 [Brassica carinata]